MCTGSFGLQQSGLIEEVLSDLKAKREAPAKEDREVEEMLPDDFFEDLIKNSDLKIKVLGASGK